MPNSYSHINNFMRFFSKLTFIFNCCFLVVAVLYYMKDYINDDKVPHQLNIVKGSIVVLGMVAWIVNFSFLLCVLIMVMLRKKTGISNGIILINFLIFICQVYYFLI